MTIASLFFGVIVSTLTGALLHFWRGGGLGHLIFYILMSWIGFWAGHFIGDAIGWQFWTIGGLNIGMALALNLAALLLGYLLAPAPQKAQKK
jgi:hypothetical protein